MILCIVCEAGAGRSRHWVFSRTDLLQSPHYDVALAV